MTQAASATAPIEAPVDDEGEIDQEELARRWATLTPNQRRAVTEKILNERIARAREDFNDFAELVCVDDESGEPIRQAPIHERWAELCEKHDRLLIWSHIESGKCEAAGARILLESGEWTDIENLVGVDRRVQLLDPSTMILRTASARAVENGVRPIVRIETKTGRVLRVTENHPVFSPKGWVKASEVKSGTFLAAARSVPEPGGEQHISALDAELIGYLTADGGLTDPHRVKFTKTDPGIVERLRWVAAQYGWELTPTPEEITYSITRRQNGSRGWEGVESPAAWTERLGLRHLSKHKRIPIEVFTAGSEAVRLFLGAYFSCDGSVEQRCITASSASKGLASDVQLLLLRLGVRATLRYKKAVCAGKAYDSWRVSMSGDAASRFLSEVSLVGGKAAEVERFLSTAGKFERAHADGVPSEWRELHPGFEHADYHKFKILATARKNHRALVRRYLQSKPDPVVEMMASEAVIWDEVVEVRTEAPEMTYGLYVDDPSHCYLSSGLLSHNTTQLSILRTVWELGRDPTLRFVILSNTSSIAIKIVKAIAQYITESEMVKRIFPDLQQDPNGPWTNSELMVVRNGLIRNGKKIRNTAKDPSVRAVGVRGALTSGRVDRLIVDDILDPEIVRTEQARKELEAWYKAVAVSRLTKRAKVLLVGTAYHPKDLLHTIARQKGFHWFRFPILDSNGNITWPEQWPRSRVEQKRNELGPAEFARSCLCKARDDDEARFRQEWIDLALAKGEGMKPVHDLKHIFPDGLPAGYTVFTGVDLGVKKTRRADETVLFSFLQDPHGNRRVLEVLAGKFTGPEIVQLLVSVYHRLQPQVIAVENNAAQDFLIQFSQETGALPLPIVPHTTSKAKHDPLLGVEGLAVELANGKWTIPNEGKHNCDPQIDSWIVEMLFYSPKAHTGDRLMACYFAREVARTTLSYGGGGPTVGCRVLGGTTSKLLTGMEEERAREQANAESMRTRELHRRLAEVPDSGDGDSDQERDAREMARNNRHVIGA